MGLRIKKLSNVPQTETMGHSGKHQQSMQHKKSSNSALEQSY